MSADGICLTYEEGRRKLDEELRPGSRINEDPLR